jgi:uncharacterized protein (TIGR02246 family)
MKRWLVPLAALGAFTLQFGCTEAPPAPPDTRAADEKAIRDGEAQWAKEMAAKDAEKNVAHYADDASLLMPNMAIHTGKDAIRGMFKDMFADKNFAGDFGPIKVDVSKGGDLAYSQGTYTITTTDPKTKKPATEKGKYLTIYRKQADGSWKAIEDMINADAPAAPAKARAAKLPRRRRG